MNAKRRRLSPYVSRLTTSHSYIWESCARMGCSPNNRSLLFSRGDCETIEQYVLHSLRNALQNYTKIIKLRPRKCNNILE